MLYLQSFCSIYNEVVRRGGWKFPLCQVVKVVKLWTELQEVVEVEVQIIHDSYHKSTLRFKKNYFIVFCVDALLSSLLIFGRTFVDFRFVV